MQGHQLSLVVPAYNEAERLGPSLTRALAFIAERGWDAEVIVVDDGSSDATAAVAEAVASGAKCPVQVLRNPGNLGKGASIKVGVAATTGKTVIFSDADFSSPVEESVKLLLAIEGGGDVAIGSRAVAGAQVEIHQAWYRELMGKTFNLMVRTISGLPIADTQCGFKAFRGDVARELFGRCRSTGFGFDVEILARARHRGYRIVEVPVVWRNSPNSRVRPVRDSTLMFLDLLRIRLDSFRW